MREHVINAGGHRLVITTDAGGAMSAVCATNPDLAAEYARPGADPDALYERFMAWAVKDPLRGKKRAPKKKGREALITTAPAQAPAGAAGGLAPWLGAKRKLAPYVVELLGPHDAYVEPFAGSMAVLFAKPRSRLEIVNDLNRDLVNVAACLAAPASARDLLGRLHFTLAAEELYRDARSRCRHPFAGELGDVDRAYDALLVWWLGRSGTAGTAKNRTSFSARFSPNGGTAGGRWRALVNSVPWFARRLAGVDVLNRDAFDVLAAVHDAAGTVVYADPPYVQKSAEYEFDSPDPKRAPDAARKWHADLAAACGRFERARVVVSYYPHPWLDELYPTDRWERVEIRTTKTMANTSKNALAGRAGATPATELLYVSKRPV